MRGGRGAAQGRGLPGGGERASRGDGHHDEGGEHDYATEYGGEAGLHRPSAELT